MSQIGEHFEKTKGSPHDAAFKAPSQKWELAKSFFRNYFPPEIVRRINFRYLKLANRSYMDEKMKDRQSDIFRRRQKTS